MSGTKTMTAPREKRFPRVLGQYEGQRPGPTFVVTGGIHGNEPGGLDAGRAVLRTLHAKQIPMRGRVIVMAGNIGALQQRVRYFDYDLNRLWTPQHLEDLRGRDPAVDTREQREQRELLGEIEKAIATGDEFVLLDLHSSSGDGAPFVCMGDTLRNRKIAFALPLPVILGLEETIDGALLDWLYELGHVAIAVEGGRHDAEGTPQNLEAAIWISLVAAGCLSKNDLPDYDEHVAHLEASCRGIARVLEIRHREVLSPADAFVMQPGFEGFDRIEKGQLLAHKNGDEVRATERGRILLPLYQGQGSDGFFVARRVLRFWLWLSAGLRRVRFSYVLPLVPGVSRHAAIPDAFVVAPRRGLNDLRIGLFHLLGYRRRRKHGVDELFTRRRERR